MTNYQCRHLSAHHYVNMHKMGRVRADNGRAVAEHRQARERARKAAKANPLKQAPTLEQYKPPANPPDLAKPVTAKPGNPIPPLIRLHCVPPDANFVINTDQLREPDAVRKVTECLTQVEVDDFIKATFPKKPINGSLCPTRESKPFKDQLLSVIAFINDEINLGSKASSDAIAKIFHKLLETLKHAKLNRDIFILLETLSSATHRLISQNAYDDYTYANIAVFFMGNAETKDSYDLSISRLLKELKASKSPLSSHSFTEIAKLMTHAVDRSPELLEIGKILAERIPEKLDDKSLVAALNYISSSAKESAAQSLLELIKPQILNIKIPLCTTMSRIFLALMSLGKEDFRELAFQALDKFSEHNSKLRQPKSFTVPDLHRLLAGLRQFPHGPEKIKGIYEKHFKAICEKISSTSTASAEYKREGLLASLEIMQEYSVIKHLFKNKAWVLNLLKPLDNPNHPIQRAAKIFLNEARKERPSHAELEVRRILTNRILWDRLKAIDPRVRYPQADPEPQSSIWFEQDLVLRITPNFSAGRDKFDVNIETDGDRIHRSKARTKIIPEKLRDEVLKELYGIHTIRISTGDSSEINNEAILDQVTRKIIERIEHHWGRYPKKL